MNNYKSARIVLFGHAVAPARRPWGRAARFSVVTSEHPSEHYSWLAGRINE
ncbi:hypothetical protein IKE99_02035 [Candidatus Saccharibacteria bacterium]|nr:hypothetical protein [Candidatus Saccharibacteria bacterium]